MEIDKRNGNIAFNEAYHRYWNVNDASKKFISVTTLIEKFGQPFDKDFWSSYKALEFLKMILIKLNKTFLIHGLRKSKIM